MKDHFEGKSPKDISKTLNTGRIEFGSKWIQSRPFVDKETRNKCYIKGVTDTVLGFNDNTFGVIDFKTSAVKDQNVEKYSRQLHAYALALENAAEGKPFLKPISKLGLFVVEPNKFLLSNTKEYLFKNIVKWQEIPRDDKKFFSFLREVVALLSKGKLPDSGHNCSHCKYVENSKNFYQLALKTKENQDIVLH